MDKELRKGSWRLSFREHYWLYYLMVPGILYMLVFIYLPMGGLVMAFQNFNPYNGTGSTVSAFFNSPFVGFKNFTLLFTGPDFLRLLLNTLSISISSIIFYFPAPIILALLLNEVKSFRYKSLVQTLVYIPHFISFVIVASLTAQLFSTTDGFAYKLLVGLFGNGAPDIMSNPRLFTPMIAIWEKKYGRYC